MNQSDAEVVRLAQEASVLFKRSSPLSEEASRLYNESARISRAAKAVAKTKEGSKLLMEAKRLMGDGDRLMEEANRLTEEGHKLLEQSKELKSRADVSEPSANYVTCRCQHCDTGIEFDAAELAEENSVVPCPHCGLETKLFVPQAATAPAAADTFQQRKADFLARHEADKPKRDAELKNLEGIVKKYESTAIVYSLRDKLELSVDRILIHRRGVANAMAAGINGERTILISSLTAIQLKLGGWLSPGYILFSYAGSKPFAGGIFAATEDPDAFIFEQALNEQVTDFKAKVEKIMRDSKQTTSIPSSSGGLADELRKLAEFKQQGILSQEEFDAAKKKLLA